MRVEIIILNNTTQEKIYALSESTIDGAIAHLGAWERQARYCEHCKEPISSELEFCCDHCKITPIIDEIPF